MFENMQCIWTDYIFIVRKLYVMLLQKKKANMHTYKFELTEDRGKSG